MKNFDNSNQFKSFMKKEANRLNISTANAYRTFISRTFLERISKYNDCEILIKGSSAETSYLGRIVRAFTDIDIASLNNYNESIQVIVNALNDKNNDIFDFDLSKSMKKSSTGIYKFGISGKFDKINQVISIDMQERYNRLIEPQIRIMPKIFEGDEEFEVYAPSFEEYLAEKLCIVLESNKMSEINTRVKDFYDIYQLHGGKYDNDKLTEYFGKIIKLRNKIKITDAITSNLNSSFVDKHKDIWNNTKKKYDFIDKEIDLEGAVYYTRAVLREQLQKNGQEMPENMELKKVLI